MNAFWFWLTHNASSAHLRLLARYLERRGWVVFYLEDRECRAVCWLREYQAARRPDGTAR